MQSIWVAKQGKREADASCHPDKKEYISAIAAQLYTLFLIITEASNIDGYIVNIVKPQIYYDYF